MYSGLRFSSTGCIVFSVQVHTFLDRITKEKIPSSLLKHLLDNAIAKITTMKGNEA